MTLAFIVNSYNRLELLKTAIDSICSWYDPNKNRFKICFVIFDAGSSDGSIEWCKAFHDDRFRFVLLQAADGDDSSFSAGLNAGVDYAIRTFADLQYLVFYETDNAFLNSVALEQAIECLEKKTDLAGCGFTVRKHDGSGAGIGMPFPRLVHFALGKNVVHYLDLEAISFEWQRIDKDIVFSYADVVFTSPLVVRTSAWIASGGLDSQSFPFSDTDIDWAKRLRRIGWRLGVIKAVAVIHDNSQQISEWSKLRLLNFHRARLRYHLRYSGFWTYLVWPLPLFARHLIEWVLASFARPSARRRYLHGVFSRLLKSCFHRYN